MSDTTNLILPYLAPGQAQKHVTVNESLRRLDAVVQLAVVSMSADAQPGSPADGAVWILPPGKTGDAWGPMANHALAYYRDGAWEQVTPREGWLAFVKDVDGFVYFDGAVWEELATGEGGGGGSSDAEDVEFDASGLAVLTADNVQDALEEIDAALDAMPGGGGGGGRELLTANRTYYVRSDGSDSNDGLTNTSGGAFLTIQKAIDIAKALDLGGYTVTVQIGDGTYTAGAVIPRMTGQGAAANLIIQGNNATPANVIVSRTGGHCFAVAAPGAMVRILDLEMRTTTSGNCINTDKGVIEFGNVRFGACAGRHVRAEAGGIAEAVGNYTISGGATHHWSASVASINVVGRTVTLSGTPAFSAVFVDSTTNATTRAFSNTYSGSATGVRHSAATGGGIQTAGAGVNNLPGNSSGSTTAPGWDA